MSSRKTIYITDKSESIIGPAESRSGRINSIISRYGQATTSAAPQLTINQWSFLADMLNSTVIDDNTGQYLWADISESGNLDGLDKKWSVDAAKFSEQIKKLSDIARWQILDVISKFWSINDQDHQDIAAQFAAAGAKTVT